MTEREIMQQALEALTAYDGTNGASQRKRVLAALRDRLAQPEQEPVKPAQQVVDSDEKAGAYMEARLWEFIDMAAAWPKASPDPRTWDHVMVYAPKLPQRTEPEQEPVVWMYVNRSTHETIFQRHMRSFVDHGNWTETPLYSEPWANHELNCVCGAVWCGDEMVHLPHKSTPPQRTWVGLTDEEIALVCAECAASAHNWNDISFARTIEAKLRSKNI